MSDTAVPPDEGGGVDAGAVDESLPKRLNLGCGEDYREGWHNVDISPAVGPDEVVDLDQQEWPWPDGHFRRIEARHVIEHLADPIAALREATRVLTFGGDLVLTYPIGHTRFEDPTHCNYWSWHTAGMLAGERQHPHEIDLPLLLVARDLEWYQSQLEPFAWAYTKARLALCGPGGWLDQVPGLCGEVTATFVRTGGDT